MVSRANSATWIVLCCAALWGFWWYPVSLIERTGLSGPWIGLVLCGAAMPAALVWCALDRGGLSPLAALGSLLVGVAVTLYAMAVDYTDFIRAVLLFYLAPAWSTLIEILFMGRRWAMQALAAIALSLGGVVLISRGEISFDGLGAIGDWMALASGFAWSTGVAMVFAARRATASRVLLLTSLGGMLAALAIAWADGSMAVAIPDIPALVMADSWPFVFAMVYVGIILGGTMWGSFRLPPAVMSYLLSVEILGGVLSSTLILGERFGPFEIGGAVCIVSAVLIEIAWTDRQRAAAARG